MPRIRTLLYWSIVGPFLSFAAATALLATLYLTTPSPASLVRQNPRTTALIEQRRAEARARGAPFRPRQSWVGLDRISPRLAEAVILSEDDTFFAHQGFDFQQLRSAAWESLRRRRLGRGASTITQQLAKNLWLGTERSLWRKAREATLTVKLERALEKRRILALYLNAAEWGDGVFGAEEAARRWFGHPAQGLSAAESAVLASMLPAPRRASLERPPRWLATRSRRLLDRMLAAGRLGADEHARSSAELERILAGPAGDAAEEPPEEEPLMAPAPEAAPAGPAPAEEPEGAPAR